MKIINHPQVRVFFGKVFTQTFWWNPVGLGYPNSVSKDVLHQRLWWWIGHRRLFGSKAELTKGKKALSQAFCALGYEASALWWNMPISVRMTQSNIFLNLKMGWLLVNNLDLLLSTAAGFICKVN